MPQIPSLVEKDDGVLLHDTQEQIEETLTSLQEGESMLIEASEYDERESRLVNTFLEDGCGCKLKCRINMGRERIELHRGRCAELTKSELDMAVLGQLAALVHQGQSASGVHRKDKSWTNTRSEFYFEGEKICKGAFLFLYGIGEKHFKSLKKHYITNGLCPRTHGNAGWSSSHAITLTDARYMYVTNFLFEYAEIHALLIPGRVPGYKRTDLQV